MTSQYIGDKVSNSSTADSRKIPKGSPRQKSWRVQKTLSTSKRVMDSLFILDIYVRMLSLYYIVVLDTNCPVCSIDKQLSVDMHHTLTPILWYNAQHSGQDILIGLHGQHVGVSLAGISPAYPPHPGSRDMVMWPYWCPDGTYQCQGLAVSLAVCQLWPCLTPGSGGRRSPAVACWASDHWVAISNPLRGKFRH